MPNDVSVLLRNAVKGLGYSYDSFTCNVRRYFTDVDGQIIDKATAPVAMRISYPVYMFGKYDFDGSYYIARNEIPAGSPAVLLRSFIAYSQWWPTVLFSGVNDIHTKISPGDLVLQYSDSLTAPSIFVWVIVSSTNKAFGSIFQMNEKLSVNRIIYNADNIPNYDRPIWVIRVNGLGLPQVDNFAPLMYRDKNYFDENVIYLNVNLHFDFRLGIATYIDFDTELLTFDFQLKQFKENNNVQEKYFTRSV